MDGMILTEELIKLVEVEAEDESKFISEMNVIDECSSKRKFYSSIIFFMLGFQQKHQIILNMQVALISATLQLWLCNVEKKSHPH
jgi:hypothetical protein